LPLVAAPAEDGRRGELVSTATTARLTNRFCAAALVCAAGCCSAVPTAVAEDGALPTPSEVTVDVSAQGVTVQVATEVEIRVAETEPGDTVPLAAPAPPSEAVPEPELVAPPVEAPPEASSPAPPTAEPVTAPPARASPQPSNPADHARSPLGVQGPRVRSRVPRSTPAQRPVHADAPPAAPTPSPSAAAPPQPAAAPPPRVHARSGAATERSRPRKERVLERVDIVPGPTTQPDGSAGGPAAAGAPAATAALLATLLLLLLTGLTLRTRRAVRRLDSLLWSTPVERPG
jgi:hypothetical protein